MEYNALFIMKFSPVSNFGDQSLQLGNNGHIMLHFVADTSFFPCNISSNLEQGFREVSELDFLECPGVYARPNTYLNQEN